MEKLELTISPEYANWGLWEAMRELIQNYLDAKDKTDRSTLHYNPESSHLRMTNYGVAMSRRALLLGNTDKRDDESVRGQWGEGMKIAWATLCRLGHHVTVTTGTETWIPAIVESKTFDGAKLLSITVQKLLYSNDQVSVEISNISPEQWEKISERVLPLADVKADEIMAGAIGRLLTSDRFQGKLFVKGLYVCELPGDWHWGYDLDNVDLDRDRKVPSAMSMEPLICSLLKDLMAQGKISESTIMSVLANEDKQEGGLFADWWNDRGCGDEFHQQVAEKFKVEHGDTAVPVSSNAESVNAENHGMRAIVVPRALRTVVEKSEGTLDERIAAQPPVTVEEGPRSKLSSAETHALDVAYNVVSPDARWGFARDQLEVVAFKNPDKLGDCRDGKIRVARRLLTSPGMLIVVIAHEIACSDHREGTIAHRNGWSTVLSQAFDGLLGKSDDGYQSEAP